MNERPLVFFPASGLRSCTFGGMGNVSGWGYSWQASPVSALQGYILRFYSTGANPGNGDYHATGFPVRCLRAFAAAVI